MNKKETDEGRMCTHFNIQRQGPGRRRCGESRGQEVMSEQEEGSRTVKEIHGTRLKR